MTQETQTSFTGQASVTINENGISTQTYQQLLATFKGMMTQIFGTDIVLDNSTMDGQLVGILCQAFQQANNAMVKIFSGFSPSNAQGAYLDSLVAINGLTRLPASYSTVDVVISGVANTQITDGVIADTNNNQWNLPVNVTIPESGSITVTATAQESGAIYASPNSVTTILTPFSGWQSVTNPNASNTGNPAESDASLRQRQAISQELPNQTIAQGLQAAILTLPNVTYCQIFCNNTDSTDSNNIPPHCISVVVGGGDTQSIAQTIANKKTLGCGTYGETSVTLSDGSVIQFQPQKYIWFRIVVNIQPTINYNDNIGYAIQQAIYNYINNANIGSTIWLSKIQAVANVSIADGGEEYIVASVTMGWSDSETGDVTQGTATATLKYYEVAQTEVSMITINVGDIIS